MEKLINIMIFSIIILVFFILSFAEKKFSYNFKKNIILIATILISVMCGIRVIGLDYENYIYFFNEGPIVILNFEFLKYMFEDNLEPVFVVMISTIKKIGLGYNTFFFISAIIPMLMIYSLVTKKENDLPLITFFFFLLLFLFRGPVDTIRHFFAAVIYLSSIYSLSQNKKISFYAKSIVSVLVHYSNVSIFLIRPFLKIRWDIKKYIFTFLAVLAIAFVSKEFFLNFITNTNVTNPMLYKFKYYLLYKENDYIYVSDSHRVILFMMMYSLVFFNIVVNLFALKFRKSIEKDKFYNLLLNSQIIGSFLIVIFAAFNAETLGLRLNFLFSIGSFFLIKELIFNYYKGNRMFLFVCVVLFLTLYNLIIISYFSGIHYYY